MLNFSPNYVAYCEQFCRGEVSNTTASYKGNEYKAFSIDIAAIDNVGCRNIVIIIDQDSGLIKAKITKQYKADGSLWYEEEAEYDYNKLDLSDDFFVFQPPEGAVEDPDMGMKR